MRYTNKNTKKKTHYIVNQYIHTLSSHLESKKNLSQK